MSELKLSCQCIIDWLDDENNKNSETASEFIENLDDIMELEVSKLGMTKQDFVAVCIAEKLGISLNDDYMMDESVYTEIRIQAMEKEIRDLEKQKDCLEKRIKGV